MVLLKVAFGVVLALFGVMCVVAGTFEVIARRRPPGRLFGRGIFPRNAPQRSDSWSPAEWRKGGWLVFSLGGSCYLVRRRCWCPERITTYSRPRSQSLSILCPVGVERMTSIPLATLADARLRIAPLSGQGPPSVG